MHILEFDCSICLKLYGNPKPQRMALRKVRRANSQCMVCPMLSLWMPVYKGCG
jgi:hypothetical protein